MGTPYTPPGTDPTGYPGPQPNRPTPTLEEEPTLPQPDDLAEKDEETE